MKIIYFGDGPWARKAFDGILGEGFTIHEVILRYHSPDVNLKQKAKEEGIKVSAPANVNDPSFVDRLGSYQADLGVSMSYDQIIRKNLMNIFPEGIINCHAGMLPYYRGRNILNWALINGEKKIGVTCHYIDSGIDTGDIILQKQFPVTQRDDYGTVLQKTHDWCAEVLIESMKLIRDGNADAKSQPEMGSYFVKRKEGDEFIDWSWPSEQVYNFVRAITDPGPCARSWLQTDSGHCLLIIRKIEMIDNAVEYNCVAGGVVGKTDDGCPLIKTGDTLIKLTDYIIDAKNNSTLKVGDRLGVNLNLMMLKNYKKDQDERL